MAWRAARQHWIDCWPVTLPLPHAAAPKERRRYANKYNELAKALAQKLATYNRLRILGQRTREPVTTEQLAAAEFPWAQEYGEGGARQHLQQQPGAIFGACQPNCQQSLLTIKGRN